MRIDYYILIVIAAVLGATAGNLIGYGTIVLREWIQKKKEQKMRLWEEND